MNRNFKKIADDCGLYIAYDNRAVTDHELDFFAQGVVLECAELIEGWVAHRIPASQYPGLLKRHFEVFAREQ